MFSDAAEPVGIDGILEEILPWLDYNFPGVQPWQQFFGMTEELGELYEAMSKGAGDIVVVDAVCDLMIFSFGYFGLVGYDASRDLKFAEKYGRQTFSVKVHAAMLVSALGRLAHLELKASQGIAVTGDVNRELAVRALYVNAFSILSTVMPTQSPESCIVEVWSKVRRRDWKANPMTAREVAS